MTFSCPHCGAPLTLAQLDAEGAYQEAKGIYAKLGERLGVLAEAYCKLWAPPGRRLQARKETAILRELLRLKGSLPFTSLSARVSGRDSQSWTQAVWINRRPQNTPPKSGRRNLHVRERAHGNSRWKNPAQAARHHNVPAPRAACQFQILNREIRTLSLNQPLFSGPWDRNGDG